jgi:hypothetical protein
MGERGKAYKFILVILAIVFLFGVSFSQRSMNEFREDKKLTHTELGRDPSAIPRRYHGGSRWLSWIDRQYPLGSCHGDAGRWQVLRDGSVG